MKKMFIGDVRGVLFKGNIDKPKMLEGRFFNQSDFYSNQNLAVVSKKYIDSIKIEEDKKYLYISDIKYEIIGIMGEKKETKLDTMLMLNLDSVDGSKSGLYALDGYKKSYVNKSFEQINIYLDNNSIRNNRIIREERGIKRIFNYEDGNYMIYIVFYIIILLSSISTLFSWYDKKRNEIYIKEMVGYGKKEILLGFLMKYFMFITISYILSFIITLIVFDNSESTFDTLFKNIILYLNICFAGLVILILPLLPKLHIIKKYR